MIIKPDQWLSEPDENGNGLLQAWVIDGNTEVPIPIETHNVAPVDVKLGQKQAFEIILECAEKADVYPDAEAYMETNEHHSMAPESLIPLGLLSSPNHARILLNGVIVRTYADSTAYGFEKDDVLFTILCLGTRYDIVLPAELAEGVNVHESNTVSCVCWVQGWLDLE